MPPSLGAGRVWDGSQEWSTAEVVLGDFCLWVLQLKATSALNTEVWSPELLSEKCNCPEATML